MNRKFWVFLVLLSSSLLAACSSTEERDASLLDDQGQSVGDSRRGAATHAYGDGSGIDSQSLGGGNYGQSGMYGDGSLMGRGLDDPQSPLSKRVIYFMFDSYQVQSEFVPVISAHAQYLAANPSQRVILEGHADERGSREYNIALGEQRAKAVARMLETQGVPASQLEIVSYGEEKPAAEGHDEAAWSLNRRVEFSYLGR